MTEQGFPADRIDTSRPHPARMYDYYLGGRDNYEVDRAAAEQIVQLVPDTRVSARGNRDFMQRAVRTVVRAGVHQILDIGTGIPTSPNTHEIAREVGPGVRVVYVDNDPIVAAHAGARLTNTGNAGFLLADVRQPETILGHPVVRDLIDFDEPVALMLVAVLHFITDEENPAGILATLTKELPKGSHLILTHSTGDFHRHVHESDVTRFYKNATASLTVRSHDQILPFFDGFDLLEPGLVQAPMWRPDTEAPDAEELRRVAFYGGVGVKR